MAPEPDQGGRRHHREPTGAIPQAIHQSARARRPGSDCGRRMEAYSPAIPEDLPRASRRSSGRNSRGRLEDFRLSDRRSAVRSAATGPRQLRSLQPALHSCVVSRVLQLGRGPSGLPVPRRRLLGRRRLRSAGPTAPSSPPHSTRTARFRSGCLGDRGVLARLRTAAHSVGIFSGFRQPAAGSKPGPQHHSAKQIASAQIAAGASAGMTPDPRRFLYRDAVEFRPGHYR
jgi:hypothetical protein